MSLRTLERGEEILDCDIIVHLDSRRMITVKGGGDILCPPGVEIKLQNVNVSVPKAERPSWEGDPGGTYDGKMLWSLPTVNFPTGLVQVLRMDTGRQPWARLKPATA